MLDSELVFSLKKTYGNIYSVTVKGTDVVFRELTFAEFNQIQYYQDLDGYSSADVEDLILSMAIVYPSDFDLNKIPPGAVSSLAQDILDLSGFFSPSLAKNVLESKRLEINEVKNLMKAFVLATITSYSVDELDEMTFSQLAEKVALSEKIIEIKQAINGVQPSNISLQLIDPEEEIEKEKSKAARHNASKMPGAAKYEDPIAKKLWGS